jgi:gliding motility-associated-like protein
MAPRSPGGWLLLFQVLLVNALSAQPPFQKLYNNGTEFAQSLGGCPMPDGGNALVGIVNTGPQTAQAFVSRLACNGEEEWTRLIGLSSTVNNTFPQVRADDQGRIWFTSNIGSFNNYDGLVGCFSPDGQLIRAVRFGLNGRDDVLTGLELGADGSVYVCGSTNSRGSDQNSNPAFHDVFVARLDSQLNVVWARTLGNKDAIDTGFDLALDGEGQVLVTGRYIVNGTFFTFLLRLDDLGTVQRFRGYGESTVPHRTYGYGITSTSDGHILLTGSTTIQKQNHQSIPDVFLIKTDRDGQPVFREIYIPVIGGDQSESGSSVREMPGGDYAIGVPTMSFTNFTQGFVPNKNAVFVTDPFGKLTGARIYNQGGSHYTRLFERPEGFLLTNFSNFYGGPNPGAGPFRPLVIVTDQSLESGCKEINVLSSLTQVSLAWEDFDITYSLDTGYVVAPYTVANTYSFSGVETLCETPSGLSALLALDPTHCQGSPVSLNADTTGEIISVVWSTGDGNLLTGRLDTFHIYQEPGTYTVQLTVRSVCEKVEVQQMVEILPLPTRVSDLTLCQGDSVQIGGAWVSESGEYSDTIPGLPCDSIHRIRLEVQICNCEIRFPNLFSPNRDGTNDTFGPVYDCELTIEQFSLSVFNRWGQLVFETSDPNTKWDGTFRGKEQPSDTYAWVAGAAYLLEGQRVNLQRRGQIMLLR